MITSGSVQNLHYVSVNKSGFVKAISSNNGGFLSEHVETTCNREQFGCNTQEPVVQTKVRAMSIDWYSAPQSEALPWMRTTRINAFRTSSRLVVSARKLP